MGKIFKEEKSISKQFKKEKGFSCGERTFEILVREAVACLPAEFRKKMENMAIIIEEDFKEELSQKKQELLGLYHGIPKRERGFWYGNALPDRIVIYKKPIERISANWEELRENIRRTVYHEIGHYFGLDEEDLKSLEEEES